MVAVSPPSSAQPARRQPSAMPRSACFARRAVELVHRQVVEEDQRLGALHDQVVHHHRDAVDADGVEAAELRRQPELGADAVGAGHEDRVLVAVGRLEEAGEAADPRQHLRAVRRARDLLDLVDEAFVVVEVDAGGGVARRRRAGGAGGSEGSSALTPDG